MSTARLKVVVRQRDAGLWAAAVHMVADATRLAFDGMKKGTREMVATSAEIVCECVKLHASGSYCGLLRE